MIPSIAVILNDNQKVSSIFEGSRVVIYEKKKNEWIESFIVEDLFRDKDFKVHIREFMNAFIIRLGDCKILVGSAITGIPYMMLDKADFILYETEEISNRLFEEIINDFNQIKQEKLERLEKNYPTKPFETKELGVFELDLRKLQLCHPTISSKMTIIPFLKEEIFLKLHIYCEHVMPWLENHPVMKSFQYSVSKLKDSSYLICIEKKSCISTLNFR